MMIDDMPIDRAAYFQLRMAGRVKLPFPSPSPLRLSLFAFAITKYLEYCCCFLPIGIYLSI